MNIGSAAGKAGADRMRIKLFHAREYSSFDSCSQEEALFHIFYVIEEYLPAQTARLFLFPRLRRVNFRRAHLDAKKWKILEKSHKNLQLTS